MSDWSLAIQGGGQRAVFACGVTDVLIEEGLMANDVYGTSAGILIGLFYAQKEKGAAADLFINGMTFRKLFTPFSYLFGGSAVNIAYIINDKKQSRLNKEAIVNGPINLYAVCTNLETFTSEYFNQKDPLFWDAVEASCSLTLFRKTPCMVGDIPCLDGGYVERIPCLTPLAAKKKTVVISTRVKGFRWVDLHEKDEKKVARRFKRYPKFVEGYPLNRELSNQQLETLEQQEENDEVFVIYPPEEQSLGLIEKDKEKLRAAYESGVATAKSLLPNLRKYLSE